MLWKLLIWLDQGFNVLLAPLLNALFRPRAARFGSEDETISSVLGKLVEAGECKLCAGLCRLFSWIDPRPGDHCQRSIERDE